MQIKRVNRPLTEEERQRHKRVRDEIESRKPELNRDAAQMKREQIEIADAMRSLKREREARGISLTELAQRSGIDKANLSRLENDLYPNPTLETLSRIARAIGVRLTIGIAAA